MRYFIFFTTGLLLLLSSCSKDHVDAPVFDVSTDALSYKAGTAVTFRFSGNPDNLTFYSGEDGKKYEYRNRTSLPGKLQVQFASLVQWGTRNNLSLFATTEISGKIDSAIVKNVKWTDISSRATFSTGADNTPSGAVDLSDFSDSGKPVSVAFRYTDVKNVTAQQNRWVIRTFNANVVREGSSTPLAVMSDAGWVGVSFKNPQFVWTITSAQLLMSGGGVGADDNEDWVISKPLDPNSIKSDVGYVLKNISSPIADFTYTYTKPGIYKVTFLASNRVDKTAKETVKEMTLTIEP